MAGHSKWANIKHRKDRADKAKGKIFSRVAKEIITAVKHGDPDPKNNPRLRLAIQKARSVNMPADNIERNIKKASNQDQADYVEMTYELYGHGGVGIVAEVMTDNKNRISSDMRIATNKRGGSIATPGSVLFNFDRKGLLQIAKAGYSEEQLMEAVMDVEAEDLEDTGDLFVVTTAPERLFQVKEALEAKGYKIEESSLEWIPKVSVSCTSEQRQANLALIDWLENLDDVDQLFHNMSDD